MKLRLKKCLKSGVKMLSKLLGKVAQKCYEITQKGKYHVFFSYEAHIDTFTIKYYVGGWAEWKDPIYIAYLGIIIEENLKNALEKLKGLENE